MPSGPSSQIRTCDASRSSRSRDDDDLDAVGAAYEAGANTYIAKPVTFLALVRLMKVFTAYWLETAGLPPEGTPREPPARHVCCSPSRPTRPRTRPCARR